MPRGQCSVNTQGAIPKKKKRRKCYSGCKINIDAICSLLHFHKSNPLGKVSLVLVIFVVG